MVRRLDRCGPRRERAQIEEWKVKELVPESVAIKLGAKVISARWVLVRKLLPGGGSKLKARLVGQQFRRNEVIPGRVSAATPTAMGFMLVLLFASVAGLEVEIGDVVTAFLQAPLPAGENVFVRPRGNERRRPSTDFGLHRITSRTT